MEDCSDLLKELNDITYEEPDDESDDDDSEDESEDAESDDESEGVESDDYESDDDNEAHEETDETNIINEIRRQQASTKLIIPHMNFSRLVREIADDYKTDLRFSKDAIMAFQTATESHIIGVLSMAQRMTLHAQRICVVKKDLDLALYAQEPMNWGV